MTGGEFPGRKERRQRLAEAIELIRRLWSEERVDFEGDFYRTAKATIYDRPDEPVPIFVAASGPLAAKLAGRVGDGFICTSGKDPALYDELLGKVAEGAEEAGRDPAAIRRMIEVKVSYDRDRELAFTNTHPWAALALQARAEGGHRRPDRDGARGRREPRPGALALHLLRRPRGGRGAASPATPSWASRTSCCTPPAPTSAASWSSSAPTFSPGCGIGFRA